MRRMGDEETNISGGVGGADRFAQRRQVDVDEPRPRDEDRDHDLEAADDAEPNPRDSDLREHGQICFVDTPGVHTSTKRLNRAMVKQAVDALSDVDVVCHVLDAAALVGIEARGGDPWAEEQTVFAYLGEVNVPMLAVLNKVDRVKPKERLLPLIAALDARGTRTRRSCRSARSTATTSIV
jgi:50S ribosomal subunit-associated GTPase HflX